MSAELRIGGVTVTLTDEALDELAELVRDRIGNGGGSEWQRGAEAAAEHLGWPARRVYELVQRDSLPVHRDGTRLVFNRTELDEWMRSQ